MKPISLLLVMTSLCLGLLAFPVRAQTPVPATSETPMGIVQVPPDLSVGVLSEDPASGQRWSSVVLPFGNYVGTVSGNAVFCRTYLHFALEAIPAVAIVQSADLHVFVDDYWPAPGSAPMSVYPVASAWTPNGVDWYDVDTWPTPGGAIATLEVSSAGGWFVWDVTAQVQSWVAGAPNYGLMVAAADLGSTISNWAAARRLSANDPATMPYLRVVYALPPTPTPTATPTPTPQPPPAATPQPPTPAATPLPPPTPVPILLPATGTQVSGRVPWGWLLIVCIPVGVYLRRRRRIEG